jgi:hypothetical protein
MGGAYVAHFAMYVILNIAHMARSGHVCATQISSGPRISPSPLLRDS